MLWLRFGVRTLARTRLSVSPVMEAMAWLRLAATARGHPVFGDPGPVARGVLRHPDVALLVDLLPPPDGVMYLPDLLTPRPQAGSWGTILHGQIGEIESAGQGDVETQVYTRTEAHWGRPASSRIRRVAESGLLPRRLAAGVARFWHETLHDDWPSLQAVLDKDIAERSKMMAVQGIGRVLGGLHPRIHWSGDTLVIGTSHRDHVIDLADHEFVLAAGILNWPGLMYQIEDVASATVYYPADGIGGTGRRGPAELAKVVGAVRTVLLGDLSVPRSTAELATRNSLSASTISYHLNALHRARLVIKRRDGRHVLYQLTERGHALIETSRAAAVG